MLRVTSPHAHKGRTTAQLMSLVVLATLPGMLALFWFFGVGVLFNVAFAGLACIGLEAIAIKLRGRPVMFYLRDYSALVTGVLLGLSLPPYCPWWIILVGCFCAIILAKQLYGGLGYNPFNPAMVGYVVLLISFPVEMIQWAAPRPLLEEGQTLMGPLSALARIWLETPVDAYSGATPLDRFFINQIYQNDPLFTEARWAGVGWEWVNIGFFAGGIFLLYKKVFTWHTPVSMLLALGIMAFFFYGGTYSGGGSPLFPWLSGGTMLGAFFIATDPVTSATSRLGKIIFGAT